MLPARESVPSLPQSPRRFPMSSQVASDNLDGFTVRAPVTRLQFPIRRIWQNYFNFEFNEASLGNGSNISVSSCFMRFLCHDDCQPLRRQPAIESPTCSGSWPSQPDKVLNRESILAGSRLKRGKDKQPAWISRPLQRQDSDCSTQLSTIGTSSDLHFPRKHLRRASSTSVISDASSQTKVGAVPALRSILSGTSSLSAKGSTLTAKRSVKFSEENAVYYNYARRYSHSCGHDHDNAVHCKLGYDCDGSCSCDSLHYDYDMFSFDEPEDIPSEKRWGIFSRFIAWLRRKRGKTVSTSEKGRPSISRPYPLGAPRCVAGCPRRGRDKRRAERRARNSRCSGRSGWNTLACG